MTNSQNLVDLEFATSQLGGNKELLNRMLGKFTDEFASVPALVEKLIAENNVKDAKLKVHTTKGLSGNLGLTALFECTKKLDQQLREGEVDQAQLSAFSQIMLDTCEFIESIEGATSNVEYKPSNESQNTQYKGVFLERLKHNEFIDDDTLHTYVDSLSLDPREKQELKTLVEELQYADAITILERIA